MYGCVTERYRKKKSAKDAIRHFSVELLEQLPLEDVKFFALARRGDLFPLNTGDSIATMPTRAEKVTYFLQHAVEPGAEEYLPKLLKVMKESKVVNLVRLADDIEAVAGIGMCMCICTDHFTDVMLDKHVYTT